MTVWECQKNGLLDTYNCPSRNDASIRCQGLFNECIYNDVHAWDKPVSVQILKSFVLYHYPCMVDCLGCCFLKLVYNL